MVDVVKELEALRQNLLDLSLRNNLLNYRPSQKRTVAIEGRTPEEVYKLFVLQEKSVRFRAKSSSKKGNSQNLEKEIGLLKTVEKILSPEEKESKSRSFPFLETSGDNETLDRKLFHIFNQANSIFEEQGYPVLYLALGFLQWNDSKTAAKNLKAPLLLVPVELKRIGKGRNFSLQWTGDEIFTSMTLQAKMKEFGIQIPEFEMPEEASGIEEYFRTVLTAISEKKDWRLLPEICLDLFNFKKFVMYKDLDSSTWTEDTSPADHPLIQKVFNPQDPECGALGFLEEEVDEKLSAKDTYHIMDADSSQIAVIEDVKAGKNLVVEGPPGTGKSQTIANTIAELIAQGKSVLFVSEKMAALQVVKSRLDTSGLGTLCLEIHSNQTRKKAVLEELEKTLNRAPPQLISPERDINELEKLKSELNDYALCLREPAGRLYSGLYTLYGVREKSRAYFEAKGLKMPSYKFQAPETWTSEAWSNAEAVLEKMEQVLPALGTIKKNPWYGCEPGVVLPSDLEEIESLADECFDSFEALETAVKTLNDLSGTSKPRTFEELSIIIDAAELLNNSTPVSEKMLKNPEWESESSKRDTEDLVSKLRQYRELKAFVDKTFHPSIYTLNTSEFEELSSSFIRIISPRYKKLKKEISSYYISEPPSQDKRILLDLACVSECKARRLELEASEMGGKKYFLEYWKGIESDPALLDEYSRWIIPFRKYLQESVFTEKSFELIGNRNNRETLETSINNVITAKEKFLKALESFGIRIKADFGEIFGDKLEAAKIIQVKSHVTKWKTETSTLVLWSQYLEYRQICLESKAAPMIGDIEAGKIATSDAIPAFEGNYADLLLNRAFRERPALSTFIREMHEGRIAKFMELDKRVLLENSKRITYSAYQETPKLSSGASRASEAGVLLNEFNRKRGHMPIRTLMKKAGGIIQKIKPCFLMSPLSIAQYLDPRSTRFDVIIFDEASQVRPEDAVGALLRGKQVVVMGDSKQLPPTDFFDTVVSFPEREPDDYITAGEMESILNVCKRSFPVKTLRWHYRSKHESLIAISNQEFYGNRLYIYPSPMQEDEKLGLKFVHLPDAVYDRGKSGVNRTEARAVAKAVFEHFSKYPDKSLGIGTFNVKQQEAIQEEIEALLKANPGFDLSPKNERGEHFFVKNLETIQGDERDVIFLSIGFGFDEDRKLSLNFGPLNHEGGERRLNVIITRAREKCVVFSNFKSRDLNLDENSAFGLKSLKIFLEFAESGKLPLPACGTGDFDSPFEQVVFDFLTGNGCEVHRQIGCAGYRLDLAIPDPSIPGRYILGIECDGYVYYSSKVARDRDRLRQQVLEGLGWKIYRVWSTDWYLHPKESKESLLEAVNGAIKQAKLQAKSMPESPVLEIREPASWAKSTNKNSSKKPSDSQVYSVSSDNTVNMDKIDSVKNTDDLDGIKSEGNKYFGTESFEAEVIPVAVFEAGEEETYSGEFLKVEERIESPLGSDILPEMALKAESIASLADENSRTPSARRAGKSKLLKFNMDFRSLEDSSEPVPEPEPEKVSFYQAYPEIDFSEGVEKKRKSRRLNEFAYIYGSERYFEPEFSKKAPQEIEKISEKKDSLEARVPLYKACHSSGISSSKDFSKISDEKLEEAVIRIVECEGPIHSEALIYRIKSDSRIPRMLEKIKQRIYDAVERAERSGKIRIEGDFYWQSTELPNLLRRRCGDVSSKIEWICDEEIKEAVRFVLNNQYSTPLQDLIVQTSRVLGIKTTRKNAWERIEKLVQAAIENNELTVTPNEMIYFAE